MGDTIVYVKCGLIEYVLSVLNSFHENKMFTYEQENNNRFPVLDVIFIMDDEKINTTVFRKDNTMIFIYIGIHFHQLAGNEGH